MQHIAVYIAVLIYLLGVFHWVQYIELFKAHENEEHFFETKHADTTIVILWPLFVLITIVILLLTRKWGAK